jgi:hypothetical protein
LRKQITAGKLPGGSTMNGRSGCVAKRTP